MARMRSFGCGMYWCLLTMPDCGLAEVREGFSGHEGGFGRELYLIAVVFDPYCVLFVVDA